ncbi:L-type lectin-domain containing receptor kinase IX.1-like [Typha latifolia]|uniref:L-type lectin-domain containing receptor kinase IX.1-like n=1 Tax=Typha latifolia TaxID=4733 RepID=UPI003C301618
MCSWPCNAKISIFLALFLFLLASLIFPASSLSFKFNFSDPGTKSLPAMIDLQGDASFNKFIWLTKDGADEDIIWSTGRAAYKDPVILWDKDTGKVADFTTHFQFIINATNQTYHGDGLAFFLSSYPSSIPQYSYGGNLGLFNGSKSITNQTVAVEFDPFYNEWDPSLDHFGIDVSSIISVASVTWPTSISNGSMANAWISYNATTNNLSLFVTYEDNPVFSGKSSLSHTIDLSKVLPENVSIGFSAATGAYVELHQILYWDFTSSMQANESTEKTTKSIAAIIIGLATGAVVMVCLMGFICMWCIRWRKKDRRGEQQQENQDDENYDESMDDEFAKGRGPRRFTYSELADATNNFAAQGKLGEGGFGAVYKGLLKDLGLEVAIKRISKGSKQGRKEYIAEVKIISQLRHRNLVELVGWCHDRGDFLLIYELMPNGSLDYHLYTTTGRSLMWSLRYNIALGLASALLYLHEEWESYVVHRDIKPSNVMLDSGFNAKLGDFGLARLVDHGHGSQTTVLAGTMGYVAPECVINGKGSRESDVYSFGIVALELACGRRPLEINEDPIKVRLVEYVWDLYGRKAILEAADGRVRNEELEVEEEIERLMVVGLWCAHPDCTARPSISQAISALKLEAPLPTLPPTMPVPMYFEPPMDVQEILSTSTAGFSSSASRNYATTSTIPTTVSGDVMYSSKSVTASGSSPSAWLLKA